MSNVRITRGSNQAILYTIEDTNSTFYKVLVRTLMVSTTQLDNLPFQAADQDWNNTRTAGSNVMVTSVIAQGLPLMASHPLTL